MCATATEKNKQNKSVPYTNFKQSMSRKLKVNKNKLKKLIFLSGSICIL